KVAKQSAAAGRWSKLLAASPDANVPRAEVTRTTPPAPGRRDAPTRPARTAQPRKARPLVRTRTAQRRRSPTGAQAEGGRSETASTTGTASRLNPGALFEYRWPPYFERSPV